MCSEISVHASNQITSSKQREMIAIKTSYNDHQLHNPIEYLTHIKRGGSKTGAPGARPPHLLFFFWCLFLQILSGYNAYTLIIVNMICSQNLYFNLYTLTTKELGICEGTSKQSPDPKNPPSHVSRISRFTTNIANGH